jgi:hypothetical protein
MIGGLIRKKPERSRCSTSHLVTISDMISSALRTRLRPSKAQREREGVL